VLPTKFEALRESCTSLERLAGEPLDCWLANWPNPLWWTQTGKRLDASLNLSDFLCGQLGGAGSGPIAGAGKICHSCPSLAQMLPGGFFGLQFFGLQICQQLISATPEWQMSTSSIRPVTSAKQIAFTTALSSALIFILRYFIFSPFNCGFPSSLTDRRVPAQSENMFAVRNHVGVGYLIEGLVGCLKIALSSITSKLRCSCPENIFWTWGRSLPTFCPICQCIYFSQIYVRTSTHSEGEWKRGLRGRNEILSIYIMGLTHMAQCVPHWRATGGPLWFRTCSEAKENTSIKLTQIFRIINCLLLVLLS